MGSGVDVVDQRRVVVAALPLTPAARARLGSQLTGARVVDIREQVERADLVLAPSCSPQTIRALKEAYPDARLVVVEIEDWEFDIDLPGPVKRLFAAGADGYVTVDSIAELAAHLAPSRAATDLPDAAHAELSALPGTSLDEIIMSTLADRIRSDHPSARRKRSGTRDGS
ncbi:MAG: hypothetical protein HKN44_02375 [Ilumatobacter sp.]|nr:hypothetical protein [Ilumatobacter sp.]